MTILFYLLVVPESFFFFTLYPTLDQFQKDSLTGWDLFEPAFFINMQLLDYRFVNYNDRCWSLLSYADGLFPDRILQENPQY
jgi:hypothetical protein